MGVILDLSKYQLDPDFAKLAELYKNGTIDGVIIRVQHGYTIPDEKYQEYVAACKQYGIPFGTYAYAAPVSTSDAIAEANSAKDRTDSASLCFAVDIEEKDCPDIVAAGQAYIDRLHELGVVHVGKYSYTSFYNTNNLAAIKADWTWVAAYGVNDGQPHTHPLIDGIDLWQFTSTAHVDGIATNVDESMVTDPNGFPFFARTVAAPTPVAPAAPVNTSKYPVLPVSTGNPIVAKVEVIADALNCRQHPDVNSPVLFVAKKGQLYNVTANINDWHEVIIDNDGHNGYLFGNNGSYLSLVRDQPQPQPVYYVIKSGDVLSKIASANGTTTAQLQAWNGIKDPNKIYAGEKIRVK